MKEKLPRKAWEYVDFVYVLFFGFETFEVQVIRNKIHSYKTKPLGLSQTNTLSTECKPIYRSVYNTSQTNISRHSVLCIYFYVVCVILYKGTKMKVNYRLTLKLNKRAITLAGGDRVSTRVGNRYSRMGCPRPPLLFWLVCFLQPWDQLCINHSSVQSNYFAPCFFLHNRT